MKVSDVDGSVVTNNRKEEDNIETPEISWYFHQNVSTVILEGLNIETPEVHPCDKHLIRR